MPAIKCSRWPLRSSGRAVGGHVGKSIFRSGGSTRQSTCSVLRRLQSRGTSLSLLRARTIRTQQYLRMYAILLHSNLTKCPDLMSQTCLKPRWRRKLIPVRSKTEFYHSDECKQNTFLWIFLISACQLDVANISMTDWRNAVCITLASLITTRCSLTFGGTVCLVDTLVH